MANSLDVAVVQPELSIGGTEQVILKIAEKFNPVIYVARSGGKTFREFADFDVRVLRGSALEKPVSLLAGLDRDERMAFAASSGIRFLRAEIRDGYDVLNPHLMPSEWIAARNRRVCWYCHSPSRAAYGWESSFMAGRDFAGRLGMKAAILSYRAVERRVAPRIAKICANSDFTRANIAAYLGRNDAEVIRPAVDAGSFSCADYGKSFFYPSRLVPEKRLEYAIGAFRKFGKAGWKLIIAGHLAPSGRNLAYLAGIKKLARGAGVSILPNPAAGDIARLYSGCSAVLFSAMREDWGIVPLEGMASSKPVISVNEGGPRESIVNGKTGFLVNSVDEMAEKMRFLADNPDACERMGRAGRKRVEQNYTWKIFLDKMEKVFKQTART